MYVRLCIGIKENFFGNRNLLLNWELELTRNQRHWWFAILMSGIPKIRNIFNHLFSLVKPFYDRLQTSSVPDGILLLKRLLIWPSKTTQTPGKCSLYYYTKKKIKLKSAILKWWQNKTFSWTPNPLYPYGSANYPQIP